MRIETLSLKDFRNYENQEIEFSPYTNVIYGDNAQGKTNILEAVYLFSQGRSHRARTDKELIRFGAEAARLEINFCDSERSYKALMQISKNGRKTITVNHVVLLKLSMLMNYLNIVMFSPEDLSLVKGSPSLRRHFMDSAISQLYPAYLISLNAYHKALLQKSTLLKNMHRGSDKTMLSVWNEQLADEGARIMKYRQSFTELLHDFARKIQFEISGEDLKISYMPSVRLSEISKEELYGYFERHAEREIDASAALFGIQRDDFSIIVNNTPARVYGSQGQQRTAALSLKIAQADYIHHIKGEYPVLLLDDIMSELDISRRTYLAERIRDKQVFITSTDTDISRSTEQTKLFRVRHGVII